MPPIKNADLQQRRVIARDYRNRRIGDFLKELRLTEGKATGFPVIRDEMAKNGNPDPVFYTDEDKTLFLVTLPCHAELTGIVTKSESKSGTKLTLEEIDEMLAKNIDLQVLSNILEFDITDVSDYIIEYIRIKSTQKVTKSTQKVTRLIGLVDLLKDEKNRNEILGFLELDNQTKNFATNIKPLIEYGIIELTTPDKPNSRLQKYRLTEKGRKLTK